MDDQNQIPKPSHLLGRVDVLCCLRPDIGEMFVRTLTLRDHMLTLLPPGVYLSRVREGDNGFPMFEVHAGRQFVQINYDPADNTKPMAELLREGEELIRVVASALVDHQRMEREIGKP